MDHKFRYSDESSIWVFVFLSPTVCELIYFQEYESELEDIDDEEEVERRRKKKTKKKRPTKTIFDEFEPGKKNKVDKNYFLRV